MALGYVIVRSFITDTYRFGHSRHIFTRLCESYGGKFLVRSDQVEQLIGEGPPVFALTIVEFPTPASVGLLLSSAESADLQRAAESQAGLDLWTAPGVEVPDSVPPASGPLGYVLAREHSDDGKPLESARNLIRAALTAHGGRYLVSSDQVWVAAGEAKVSRLTLIEFPSMAELREALAGADIRSVKGMWQSQGVLDLWAAPGLP